MKICCTVILLVVSLNSVSQSVTPTINSYKRTNQQLLEKLLNTDQKGFPGDSMLVVALALDRSAEDSIPAEQAKAFFAGLGKRYEEMAKEYAAFMQKATWFMPFRNGPTALQDAFNGSGHAISSVGNVLISPSFGTNDASTIYAELISAVPWNVCRISIGSHLVKADLEDSTKTAQDIALSKLTNGGGNIVLNLSRPLIYADGKNQKGDVSRFFSCGIDINGYADLSGLNQDVYNPGAGVLFNLNLDLRLLNLKSASGSPGNLVRIGLNARNQFNIFNGKYKEANRIDDQFKSLNITSTGGYLGIGPFNLQYTYNFFNKKGEFFDDKRSKLRLEVIPIRF